MQDGAAVKGSCKSQDHRFTVQISEACPKSSNSHGCFGEATLVPCCDRIQQKAAFKEFHFSCPLNDVYTSDYYEDSQRKKMQVSDACTFSI